MSMVEVGQKEPLEKALRRLKKKIEREGTLKAIRARRHYEKPSVKKKRKRMEALKKKKLARYF